MPRIAFSDIIVCLSCIPCPEMPAGELLDFRLKPLPIVNNSIMWRAGKCPIFVASFCMFSLMLHSVK